MPETWPPGSWMHYVHPEHRGIGLVVGNTGDQVTVLWDANSGRTLCIYDIASLNAQVIFTHEESQLLEKENSADLLHH